MTQYPSISITTFHDVEILVRYFESNRGFYDNVVESWIRDNIGDDKDVLDYYSEHMSNAFTSYWAIVGKRVNVFNPRNKDKLDKRIKRFEDLLIKLKAFKQEFEAMTISMTIESQWVYKVVSLPQPFASLLVMGLLDEFRVSNIGSCKEGDFVYVYATEMTQEAKEKLGDLLLDVAKYIITAVLLATWFDDVSNWSRTSYLVPMGAVIMTAFAGISLYDHTDQVVEEKKKRKKKK